MTKKESLTTDKDLENFKRSFREVGDLSEGNALWNLLYDFVPNHDKNILLNGEINYTLHKETYDVCPLLQLQVIGNNIFLVFRYNNQFYLTSNKKNMDTMITFSTLIKKTYEKIIDIIANYPSDKIKLYTFDHFQEIMFCDMSNWIDSFKDKKQFSDTFDYDFTDQTAFSRIERVIPDNWTDDKDFIESIFCRYNRDAFNKMKDLRNEFFDKLKEIRLIIQSKLEKNPDFDSGKAYKKLLLEKDLIPHIY